MQFHLRSLFTGLVLIVLPLTGQQTAKAGLGTWTSNGPEGGQVTRLAQDPFAANTLYAAGRGGLFKSTNEGLSWVQLGGGLAANFVNDVVADPLVANRVFAVSAGTLYRSTDGGANWSVTTSGLPPGFAPFRIEADPTVAGRVYLAGNGGGVFRSDDGGVTWSAANAGLPDQVLALAIDPANNLRLLAGIGQVSPAPASAIYESLDGGMSWAPVTGPWTAGSEQINVIHFGATAGDVFVGTNFGRLTQSSDNGATWPTDQFFSNEVRDITSRVGASSIVYLALGNGLLISNDGGATFVDSDVGITSNGIVANGVNDVQFRAGSATVLYAGADFSGFYRSADSGASWLPRNAGLRHTNIRAVDVNPDPANANNVFSGYGDAFGTPSPSIYTSVDSGGNWVPSNGGLEATHIRDIEIDPNTAVMPATSVVYATGVGNPTFLTDGSSIDGNGGIYKSSDGGVNWTTIDSGIPFFGTTPDRSMFGTVRAIAFDPSSGLAGSGPLQTLFVAGSGRISYDASNMATVEAARIYKSTDAGATWMPSDTGLPIPPTSMGPSAEYRQIVIPLVSQYDSGGMALTLYAGTFISRSDSTGPFPTFANGVFRSTDGGANWVHRSNGLPTLDGSPGTSQINIFALAVHPDDPDIVYAAGSREDFVGRVYKTVDGGANWVESTTGITLTQDIRALLIDPANPDTVFAASGGVAGNPGGVFRTTDAGASWQSMSIGLPDSITALDIDNSGVDPLLYAGTVSGTYSNTLIPDGDTDGSGNATENAAPNGGDGNLDGMQDADQADVTSLPATAVGRGDSGNYVTLTIFPISGTCANLVNVYSVPENELPADGTFSYPHGVLQFELPDCELAQVEIIFHDADFQPFWQFRNYGPTTPGDASTVQWYDFTANTINNGNRWTVNVEDGAFGDIRPDNGTILFRGGPGFSEVIFADGLETGP